MESINREQHPEIFQAVDEYFGVQVHQEFPDVARNFIKEKLVQPQLEGFEDSHIDEMIIVRDGLIEQVQQYQAKIHGLMFKIYRLQEGIEMETIRGNNGIWSKRQE